MEISNEYTSELENNIFQYGEAKGRLNTALSILTDSLLALNSLELFYQKPISKSVSPTELKTIKKNIEQTKFLIQEIIKS